MTLRIVQSGAPEVVAEEIPGSCPASCCATSTSATSTSGNVMIAGNGAQIVVNKVSIQRIEIDAGGQDDRNPAHPAIPGSLRSFRHIRAVVAASAPLSLPRRPHGNVAKGTAINRLCLPIASAPTATCSPRMTQSMT